MAGFHADRQESGAKVMNMKKNMNELPPEVQAQMRSLESLPDDEIDTTDAPEILDWADARRGVFYQPEKPEQAERSEP